MKTELQMARAAKPCAVPQPWPGPGSHTNTNVAEKLPQGEAGRESRDKNAGPHDEYIISLDRNQDSVTRVLSLQ